MSATAHDGTERDGGQDALLGAYRLLLRIGQRHEGEPASAEASQRWGAVARQAAAQGEPPDHPPPEMREGGSRTTRSRLTKSVSTATTTGPYTEGSNRA